MTEQMDYQNIAAWYDSAQHAPAATCETYAALIRETMQQYIMLSVSYVIEPWLGAGQPYRNSRQMFADIVNGHLYYYTGGQLPNDHHMLTQVLHDNANNIFRAVHDLNGHWQSGGNFSLQGETAAYLAHKRMYSPVAQAALFCETIAQVSWFYAGPFAHLPRAERPYAEQKCCVVPDGMLVVDNLVFTGR